jgi:hypothetical protein
MQYPALLLITMGNDMHKINIDSQNDAGAGNYTIRFGITIIHFKLITFPSEISLDVNIIVDGDPNVKIKNEIDGVNSLIQQLKFAQKRSEDDLMKSSEEHYKKIKEESTELKHCEAENLVTLMMEHQILKHKMEEIYNTGILIKEIESKISFVLDNKRNSWIISLPGKGSLANDEKIIFSFIPLAWSDTAKNVIVGKHKISVPCVNGLYEQSYDLEIGTKVFTNWQSHICLGTVTKKYGNNPKMYDYDIKYSNGDILGKYKHQIQPINIGMVIQVDNKIMILLKIENDYKSCTVYTRGKTKVLDLTVLRPDKLYAEMKKTQQMNADLVSHHLLNALELDIMYSKIGNYEHVKRAIEKSTTHASEKKDQLCHCTIC